MFLRPLCFLPHLAIRRSMFSPSAVKTDFLFWEYQLEIIYTLYWLSLTSFMISFVTVNTCTGGYFCSFIWKMLSFLCFWSLFNTFWGFLSVHFLNEFASFAKSHSCQLSLSLTRSFPKPNKLSNVNFAEQFICFSLFMVSRACTLITNFWLVY